MIDVFARSVSSGEIIPGYRFEFKEYAKAIQKYQEFLFDQGLRSEGARIMLIDDWDTRRSRQCRLALAEEREREERFFKPVARTVAA